MRLPSLITGQKFRNITLALIAGGAVVASCTFSPGPAGSVEPSGSSTGSTNTGAGLLGAAATTGGTVSGSGGTPGTSTGAGASTPSPDGANCGLQQYGLENVPPDLLVVLDKSGSMANQPDDTACPKGGGACETKWADTTTAIDMVVTPTQATIRWGLDYFPKGNECAVNAGADVAIAPNNGTPITTSIAGTAPGGRTPTRTAIMAAATYLNSLTDTNPKYILLATDGEPNCTPGAKNTSDPDDAGAEAAVLAVAMAGIPVYVVGVGNTGAVDTLNQLAVNGGRPQAGMTKYYPVNNTADLVSVLTMIGGQITSCTFGLGAVPPVPSNVGVYSDPGQVKIPHDTTHANGWDYGAGMKSIELFGTACTDVQSKKTTKIQAIFGCPGVQVP
jgi:hypothetical protein